MAAKVSQQSKDEIERSGMSRIRVSMSVRIMPVMKNFQPASGMLVMIKKCRSVRSSVECTTWGSDGNEGRSFTHKYRS